jgi:FkbM family methyltransferase
MAVLGWLERGARVMRAIGLGRLVNLLGERVGALFSRRVVTVDGLRLAGNHAGHLYYLRELRDGRESCLVRLARDAVRPGDLAVDGGAHLGYVSLQLARAGASVKAYEPNARVQPALRRNILRNGYADRIELVQRALGSERATGRLTFTGGGDASTLSARDGEDAFDVEVVCLDDELGDYTPMLVKLDLEGWELEAA